MGEFKCDLCGLSYSTQQDLTEHESTLMHHIKVEKKQGCKCVHTCEVCKEKCADLTVYGQHLQSEKHKTSVEKLKKKKTQTKDGRGKKSQTLSKNRSCEQDKKRQQSPKRPTSHREDHTRFNDGESRDRQKGRYEDQPASSTPQHTEPARGDFAMQRQRFHSRSGMGPHHYPGPRPGGRYFQQVTWQGGPEPPWRGPVPWNKGQMREPWGTAQAFRPLMAMQLYPTVDSHMQQHHGPSEGNFEVGWEGYSTRSQHNTSGSSSMNSSVTGSSVRTGRERWEMPSRASDRSTTSVLNTSGQSASSSRPRSSSLNLDDSQQKKSQTKDKGFLDLIIDDVLKGGSGKIPEKAKDTGSKCTEESEKAQCKKPSAASPRHDEGAMLLEKAENLCKSLRNKRHQMQGSSLSGASSHPRSASPDTTLGSHHSHPLKAAPSLQASADMSRSNLSASSASSSMLQVSSVSVLGQKAVLSNKSTHNGPSSTSAGSAKSRRSTAARIARPKSSASMNKESMMKLINSPRSHKERMQISKILGSYQRSQKQTARPRLQLQVNTSEADDGGFKSDDQESDVQLQDFNIEDLPSNIQDQIKVLIDNVMEDFLEEDSMEEVSSSRGNGGGGKAQLSQVDAGEFEKYLMEDDDSESPTKTSTPAEAVRTASAMKSGKSTSKQVFKPIAMLSLEDTESTADSQSTLIEVCPGGNATSTGELTDSMAQREEEDEIERIMEKYMGPGPPKQIEDIIKKYEGPGQHLSSTNNSASTSIIVEQPVTLANNVTGNVSCAGQTQETMSLIPITIQPEGDWDPEPHYPSPIVQLQKPVNNSNSRPDSPPVATQMEADTTMISVVPHRDTAQEAETEAAPRHTTQMQCKNSPSDDEASSHMSSVISAGTGEKLRQSPVCISTSPISVETDVDRPPASPTVGSKRRRNTCEELSVEGGAGGLDPLTTSAPDFQQPSQAAGEPAEGPSPQEMAAKRPKVDRTPPPSTQASDPPPASPSSVASSARTGVETEQACLDQMLALSVREEQVALRLQETDLAVQKLRTMLRETHQQLQRRLSSREKLVREQEQLRKMRIDILKGAVTGMPPSKSVAAHKPSLLAEFPMPHIFSSYNLDRASSSSPEHEPPPSQPAPDSTRGIEAEDPLSPQSQDLIAYLSSGEGSKQDDTASQGSGGDIHMQYVGTVGLDNSEVLQQLAKKLADLKQASYMYMPGPQSAEQSGAMGKQVSDKGAESDPAPRRSPRKKSPRVPSDKEQAVFKRPQEVPRTQHTQGRDKSSKRASVAMEEDTTLTSVTDDTSVWDSDATTGKKTSKKQNTSKSAGEPKALMSREVTPNSQKQKPSELEEWQQGKKKLKSKKLRDKKSRLARSMDISSDSVADEGSGQAGRDSSEASSSRGMKKSKKQKAKDAKGQKAGRQEQARGDLELQLLREYLHAPDSTDCEIEGLAVKKAVLQQRQGGDTRSTNHRQQDRGKSASQDSSAVSEGDSSVASDSSKYFKDHPELHVKRLVASPELLCQETPSCLAYTDYTLLLGCTSGRIYASPTHATNAKKLRPVSSKQLLVKKQVVGNHSGAVLCLQCEESIVYSGGQDCHIMVQTLQGKHLKLHKYAAPLRCFALGTGQLFIGLGNGSIMVFCTKTRTNVEAFRNGTSAIVGLAVAREGTRQLMCVAAEDSCSITVRDASTGLLMRMLEGHTRPCSTLQVLNHQVISGSADNTLQIHNLNTGELEKRLRLVLPVTHLCKPLPPFALAALANGTIVRYNVKDGKELMYFACGREPLSAMVLCDKQIIAMSKDGKIESIDVSKKLSFGCKFDGCGVEFGELNSLQYHMLCDHIVSVGKVGFRCRWGSCRALLPPVKSHIMRHINKHVFTHK